MEEKINEAREQFNAILDYVLAAAIGYEIHEVEISIHRMVLALGKLLLELFVLSMGTGKTGMTLADHNGRTYRYLRDSPRNYMSLFGEIVIPRAYYYREGQEGLFPLDPILNLPERKYSCPLQDKMASGAVKESYEATSASIKKDLYLDLAHRPIQEVARDCTAVVEEGSSLFRVGKSPLCLAGTLPLGVQTLPWRNHLCKTQIFFSWPSVCFRPGW